VSALVLAAFVAGQLSSGADAVLDAESTTLVLPQGRGVNSPPPPPTPIPTEGSEEALVYETGGGQSGSANGFIAVTGSYGVGTSVLYVLDTENRQLAVYEARGGSLGTRRLTLVGARRIDLDLRLQGYNDKSEFSFGELQRRFEQRGAASGDERVSPETGPGTPRK